MSTILDALKKSEQERKLNNVPTLADMPTPEEATMWPMMIGAAVAVLLLLLIIVLIATRGPSETQINSPASTTSVASAPSPGVIAQDTQIEVNVVSYSDQAEDRFVMVNGKLFREGEFVRAGLKVVEIKPESVIFNERGKRIEQQP